MNKCRLITLSLTCLLLLFIFTLTGCGGGGGETLSFTVDSKVVGDTYQIYVSLPAGYDGTDVTTRYNTIYLLDGNYYYTGVTKSIKTMVVQHKMEPVILVALCPIEAVQGNYTGTSPSRVRDLTPTYDASFPGSGHSYEFSLFIRDELIPYIDTRYRTNPDRANRGIMGQSLGGLFTWYAVFNMNDAFSKFVPASASLWWDGNIFYTYEAQYSLANTDLLAKIYSTVSTDEGATMVVPRDEIVTHLNGRSYPGLSIQTATYSGISHEQTGLPSFQDGLEALF